MICVNAGSAQPGILHTCPNGPRRSDAGDRRHDQRSPFTPAPLQSLHHYYGLLRPCAPHRYSDPRGSRRSDVSLCIGATGSHVPYKSLIRLRAAYVPDVARAVFRTAPELIPGAGRPPGFDIVFGISTLHQRFACARLSGSHLTGSCPAFCCNAHHHRF